MASPVRFSDVKRMLESRGYVLSRVAGSHHVFTKAGAQPVTVPVHHGKVKPVYVRQIEKIPEKD